MNLRLGKLAPKFDNRTIKLSTIMRALPPIPEVYDVDTQFPFQIPMPVFANNQYGNCVIAGRAHQTYRFEAFEQNKLIEISDKDVINQYFKESGGNDRGLVMIESLKSWRKEGWSLGQKQLKCLKWGGTKYDIHAFASINQRDINEVRAVVYLLTGVYVGLMLPASAQDQFNYNKVWEVDYGIEGSPGSWGGHCVYVNSYNLTGPICITWGKLQPMTWKFFFKYCDEAYGVVDNRNAFMEDSPVDVEKLNEILKEITK